MDVLKAIAAFFAAHMTKILGTASTVVAATLGAAAAKQIPDLVAVDSPAFQVLTLLNILLGGATIGVGFNNSGKLALAKSMEAAINATPPKQGGFARVGVLLAVAVAAMVLLTGCASNQAQELTYRIGTRQAVQRYIWDAGTDAKRAERASRINAAATALKAVATGDAVTLAQLREAAYREIARHQSLIPPDVELLRDLVDAVVEYLEGQVGAGVLDPDKALRVSEVLDWVVSAAVYTPPS